MFDWFWHIYERFPKTTARVIVYTAVMLVFAAILVSTAWVIDRVQAADGGGDEPTLCEPWMMAGGVLNYRCEDDATGAVCFANGFGMLACVEG